MTQKLKTSAGILIAMFITTLTGCGGAGSDGATAASGAGSSSSAAVGGGSSSSAASIAGIATPSNVSVVTATNAP